jgi:hypothetical protein
LAPYKALVCIWSTANFSPPWGALRNCSQQGERSAQYAEHGPDRERGRREEGVRNRHLGRGLLARSRQGIAAAHLAATHAPVMSKGPDHGHVPPRMRRLTISRPTAYVTCNGSAPSSPNSPTPPTRTRTVLCMGASCCARLGLELCVELRLECRVIPPQRSPPRRLGRFRRFRCLGRFRRLSRRRKRRRQLRILKTKRSVNLSQRYTKRKEQNINI